MANEAKKYTTTEIGKLLGVNYTTVNNWVRAGRLKAYKTPGGHRRILEGDLIDFLVKYEMPIPPELDPSSKPYILIVDDEEPYLRALKRWFQQATNYRVETTTSGMEALLIAGEDKPVLMLLDIVMPGIDGIELCKTIKSRPSTAEVIVIGLTGRADEEIRDEMMRAGAVECLDKNIQITELYKIVEEYIKLAMKKKEAD